MSIIENRVKKLFQHIFFIYDLWSRSKYLGNQEHVVALEFKYFILLLETIVGFVGAYKTTREDIGCWRLTLNVFYYIFCLFLDMLHLE